MNEMMRRATAFIAYGVAPRLTTALMYEHHLGRGRTEPEVALLPWLCDRSRASLDVGASRGVYSFHMAKFSSKVLAFEPNPASFKVLARRMPPYIELHKLALSDMSGTAILRVPTDRGRATIEPCNKLRGLGLVSNEQVEARRLDDLRLLGPVGFVKIDVEGHELAVLRGGKAILQRDRPHLLMEVEERHRPGSLEQVRSLLGQLGYRGYFLHRQVVHPIEEFDAGFHQRATASKGRTRYINNFIFVTGDRGEQCMDCIRSSLARALAHSED